METMLDRLRSKLDKVRASLADVRANLHGHEGAILTLEELIREEEEAQSDPPEPHPGSPDG